MSGFLYFACVLTGVLSGGALGYAFGGAFIGGPVGRWGTAAVCGLVAAAVLLLLGRKLVKLMHEE